MYRIQLYFTQHNNVQRFCRKNRKQGFIIFEDRGLWVLINVLKKVLIA